MWYPQKNSAALAKRALETVPKTIEFFNSALTQYPVSKLDSVAVPRYAYISLASLSAACSMSSSTHAVQSWSVILADSAELLVMYNETEYVATVATLTQQVVKQVHFTCHMLHVTHIQCSGSEI
jgi:hypothetical protein